MSDTADIELAKRLACAWISYQTGTSYQTTWNTHVKGIVAIKQYWLNLASMVINDCMKDTDSTTGSK